MRPPAAPTAHTPPAHAAGRRRGPWHGLGRWRLPAALLPLALLLHLALLQALQPPPPPPVRLPAPGQLPPTVGLPAPGQLSPAVGLPRPGQLSPAMQVRVVAAPPAADGQPAVAREDAGGPPTLAAAPGASRANRAHAAAAPAPGAPPAVAPTPVEPALVAAAPVAPTPVAPALVVPALVVPATAPPAPATPTTGPAPAPVQAPSHAAEPVAPLSAQGGSGPDPDPDPAPPAAPVQRPPPLYAAQVPPPMQAVYAFQREGRLPARGQARLDWQHDGTHYRLQLQAQAADGRVLLQQASQGRLDGHGLVPQRLLARGRSPRQLAVNFDWEASRIGFSGVALSHVAWPGVQDALSWLPQLLSVLAALPAAQALELVVVDPRGGAATWAWQQRPAQTLASPWGPVQAAHWQRLPPAPDGLQVDLWLAVPPGGSTPWPLRLQWQLPRHGHLQRLELLAPPGAAPAAPAATPGLDAAAGPLAPGGSRGPGS